MASLRELLERLADKLSPYIRLVNNNEGGDGASSPLTIRLLRVVAFTLAGYLLASTLLGKSSKPAVTAPPVTITWKPFSDFLSLVKQQQVDKVWFGDDDVVQFSIKGGAEGSGGVTVTRRVAGHVLPLANSLHDHQVHFEQIPRNVLDAIRNNSSNSSSETTPVWKSLLMVALPAVYIGLFGYVTYRMLNGANGGNDPLNNNSDFGKEKSKSKNKNSKSKKTAFADVQGVNSARDMVREVCAVLQNPELYAKAGARLPTGVLMVGPPGTGKTMMARAMANEAGIPFFYCNGSEFVEVYSGRGAARVRALFEKAEKRAPAIVFIDEIDALGGSRGGHQNNEEREQTLNQLLCCMDGFDTADEDGKRVVVIGATNRYEYLDKALVRPGRFDRICRVDLPTAQGRLDILRVHTRDMQLGEDVDLSEVARECGEGWSGAELASLANEAAIRAVRAGREVLCLEDFRDALQMYMESRNKKTTKNGGNGKQPQQQQNGNGGVNWASLFQSMTQQQQQSSPSPPPPNGYPEADELD